MSGDLGKWWRRSSYRVFAVVAAIGVLAGNESAADLVAHYSFDETNGSTTLTDDVGSADGDVSQVAFVTSGAGVPGSTGFGNAGVFNGVDAAVVFGSESHPTSFDLGTADFTIAGWFRTPTNFLNEDRALFQSQSFSGGGWSFEIGRADRTRRGKVYLTVGGGSAATFALTQPYSDVRLDNDQWHWVAVVNVSGTLSMYVDGALQIDQGTMQPTSTATAPATTEAAFGARTGITPFEGQIDEWSVYNEALTGVLDGGATGMLTSGALYDLWQFGVAVDEGIRGDYDGNDIVEQADYDVWKQNYGTTNQAADGNLDGVVDAADYTIWRDNLGFAMSNGQIAAFHGSTVPEPSSIVGMGVAVVCLVAARRPAASIR